MNKDKNQSYSSLNVIALVSGGKDSIYSLIHCLRNGHRVVALANVYPSGSGSRSGVGEDDDDDDKNQDDERGDQNNDDDDERDLNSHMYQTAGHSILPLYGEVLLSDAEGGSGGGGGGGEGGRRRIPIYRGEIRGGAVERGRYYHYCHSSSSSSITTVTATAATAATALKKDGDENRDGEGGLGDETESLVPLLKRVMEAHPEANALCSGAILSTYQRTRVESVAVRLGLIPLAWLWMYTSFLSFTFPSSSAATATATATVTATATSVSGGRKDELLLDHMAFVGLDARIVKVASGGLDEKVIWGDVVADPGIRGLVRKGVGRFGGSMLGEGGEFETVVVDGPGGLFRGRIVVGDDGGGDDGGDGDGGKRVVTGEGGEVWVSLDLERARVEMKDQERNEKGGKWLERVAVPCVWDDKFKSLLLDVDGDMEERLADSGTEMMNSWHLPTMESTCFKAAGSGHICNLAFPGEAISAAAQTEGISTRLKEILSSTEEFGRMSTDSIVFTTILLRSMEDFTEINAAYAKLFTRPNPPARVTVACGDTLPKDVKVAMSFVLDALRLGEKEGLHVQSRSYWAPANIGPYSQAISVPTTRDDGTESTSSHDRTEMVYIAGQIPLIPSSMEVFYGEGRMYRSTGTAGEQNKPLMQKWHIYVGQLCLSLQHLWRIGLAMKIDWWVGGVTFVAGDESIAVKAQAAWEAWTRANSGNHNDESGEDENESVDPWDQRYGVQAYQMGSQDEEHLLPNFSILDQASECELPHFTVQVDQLPRSCLVEWQGLGVRTGKLHIRSDVFLDGMLRRRRVSIGGSMWFSFYEILDSCTMGEMESCFRLLREEYGENGGIHATIYTAGRAVHLAPPGQIVPCRSVWGRKEVRLACGVILRGMENGETIASESSKT